MVSTQRLPNLFNHLETDGPVYQPRPVPLFRPQRIILTKGSVDSSERRSFIERICALYPRAEEQLGLAACLNTLR